MSNQTTNGTNSNGISSSTSGLSLDTKVGMASGLILALLALVVTLLYLVHRRHLAKKAQMQQLPFSMPKRATSDVSTRRDSLERGIALNGFYMQANSGTRGSTREDGGRFGGSWGNRFTPSFATKSTPLPAHEYGQRPEASESLRIRPASEDDERDGSASYEGPMGMVVPRYDIGIVLSGEGEEFAALTREYDIEREQREAEQKEKGINRGKENGLEVDSRSVGGSW
jgi:hypothetical protein